MTSQLRDAKIYQISWKRVKAVQVGEMIQEVEMILVDQAAMVAAMQVVAASVEVEVAEEVVEAAEATEEDSVVIVKIIEVVVTASVEVLPAVVIEVVVVATKKRKVTTVLLAVTAGEEIRVKPGELDQAQQEVMITLEAHIKRMVAEEVTVFVVDSMELLQTTEQVLIQLLNNTQIKMIHQALEE